MFHPSVQTHQAGRPARYHQVRYRAAPAPGDSRLWGHVRFPEGHCGTMSAGRVQSRDVPGRALRKLDAADEVRAPRVKSDVQHDGDCRHRPVTSQIHFKFPPNGWSIYNSFTSYFKIALSSHAREVIMSSVKDRHLDRD